MANPCKIAIVHDWLVTYAGAERVLEQMILCYPEAEVFSLVDFIPPEQRGFLKNRPVTTTFIQKLPFAKTRYRQYLPLMPKAIESLDLSQFDLILSSSHAVAKGVKKRNGQLHLAYVHTPMRYAWDLQDQYLQNAKLNRGIKGRLARGLLRRLRDWDKQNTRNVDAIIANSKFIAQRIKRNYGRNSTIIYPPVDTGFFELERTKEDFYLAFSRLVPYKKIGLIVETFSKFPDKKLIVIGDGPELPNIRKNAGPNIKVLGYQPSSKVKNLLQRAKALVFAAEEDFGISVVEAQACGTPVIAFGRGGAIETVNGLESKHPTGIFFQKQDEESLRKAIITFDKNYFRFQPEKCRENTHRFGLEEFRRKFSEFVGNEWLKFTSKNGLLNVG